MFRSFILWFLCDNDKDNFMASIRSFTAINIVHAVLLTGCQIVIVINIFITGCSILDLLVLSTNWRN